ncbi:ABC transporter substrate-binding protein [Bradyrhizobium elkanii]|uniref:ABC transporter substrate-binding protein n=1 Tax=Bradyrhizobium elkanii TaxID=29448 RepID=UPI0009B67294|nr:ABC transporter substrate-binding protein [Bradyrhizobium elkanii]WLA84834.1 ABC transporter substrate-binding protein [Bradyrhizobium elkanii]
MQRHPIRTISRRRAVSVIAGGFSGPFIIRSVGAQSVLPEQATVPSILKGSGEVRIASFGGTLQEAQRQAFFEPFENATGIKVRIVPAPDIVKVKAMVESGNIELDVVHSDLTATAYLMKAGDYLEKIDYSLVDDGVGKLYRHEYELDFFVYAQVMAYRTDAFERAAPASWADFWDTKKFPGDRAMYGMGAGDPELEFALMAAGVAPEGLYPLDVDGALASYDNIKKSVAKWWQLPAQAIQLLADREVTMTTVYNGRMEAMQAQGLPAAICWNQGLARRDGWLVPKGAKNKVNAMKFIAYSTMPIPQARFALAITYGPVNESAFRYLPPERLSVLPSSPEIRKQLVPFNYNWWSANRETAIAKFAKWLLG